MKKMFILAAACMLLFACSDEKKEEAKTDDASKSDMSSTDKKPASELLDLSMADPVKKSFAAFAKGDVEAMTADYDDNIRYTWSGGDSAIGKKAVQDYYKGRWNLIQSLSFSNEIALPLQVNESQQPAVAPPGKWVLYWAQVDVTYKNGKKLTFWSHNVNHFNSAGKIDFVGQYIDTHPLREATKDLMKK
ncbi:MAG TPA: nuclear transport factor 2 family protein [Chitinophagaceae bacterium]|nr:nuclear transport factor 2 family protein [Chitinophagaceae bacterium]